MARRERSVETRQGKKRTRDRGDLDLRKLTGRRGGKRDEAGTASAFHKEGEGKTGAAKVEDWDEKSQRTTREKRIEKK